MYIDLPQYQEIIHGYSLIDCAVRNKDMFVFIASQILSDEELDEYEEEGLDLDYRPKRIITFLRNGSNNDTSGRRWFGNALIGWDTIRIGASNLPQNHSLTVEMDSIRRDGRTFITGSGPAHIGDRPRRRIDGGFDRGGVDRMKTINGFLYAVGGNRTLGKWLGENKWQSLIDNLPALKRKTTTDAILESGFDDVDGFSETDIYAGGGKGDVWHFDGENWEPIPFPTNDKIFSLCCGGDGFVYVSCYGGMTFKGRGDNWEKIHNGGISGNFRDMVWHKDRVYCTNDYGVWTIHNGKVKATNLPDEIHACSGHLYANDGVMLLAGLGGAAYCEDGNWALLYNRSTMDNLLMLSELETKATE